MFQFIFKFLVAISLFISPCVRAKTLFISDIDDTIKISHILDTADAIRNAPRIDNHFYGMSAVYQAYKKNDPSVRFAYVSNAIQSLMTKPHQLFLKFHSFPAGDLYLRKNINDKEFKLVTIRGLIKSHTPTSVILVGDNGELDPKIYESIRSEFPQLPILTFIHQVYSRHAVKERGAELEYMQQGFVTSVDLANLFQLNNLIDVPSLNNVLINLIPKINSQRLTEDDGAIAFPRWLDCRDFFGIVQFQKLRLPRQPTLTLPDLIKNYQTRLFNRCSSGTT